MPRHPGLLAALSLLLSPGLGLAQSPWPEAGADARVRVEALLSATRFRGVAARFVDQTDAHTRLSLDTFAPEEPASLAATLHADFELGSDFGPDPAVLERVPDARRAELDLYQAHIKLKTPREALILWLGRHLRPGLLSFDAVDGATVQVQVVPHQLVVSASAGLAPRRAWSSFGPDLFEPDGTALRDQPSQVVAAQAQLTLTPTLALQAAFKRQSEGDDPLLEDAAISLSWGSTARALTALAHYEALSGLFPELSLEGQLTWGAIQLRASAARTEPVFPADSIWNAFGASPAHRFSLGAEQPLGDWRIGLDATAWRTRPDGDTLTDAEGSLTAARIFTRLAQPGSVSLMARHADGESGQRSLVALSSKLPIALPARGPFAIFGTLGAVTRRDDVPLAQDALSGWVLAGLSFPLAETIELNGLVEGFASHLTPFRLRALVQAKLVEWL